MLWLALLYGVRHFFLLAASKLMPLESSEIPWIALQAQPDLLWADLPALLVLLATGHRIPDALRVMRWVWLHGRWILVTAYGLAIALFIGLNLTELTEPRNMLAATLIVLTDLALIGFLIRSELVKDIFSEFPELTKEKPQELPAKTVSSIRQLAEELDRERRAALLADTVLANDETPPFKMMDDADAPQLLALAARHESANRLAEAETVYRALLGKDPASAAAWHALGLLAFQAGKREQGVAMVNEAVKIDGQDGIFRRNLCEMHRRMGQLEEAIKHGRMACRLSPQDAEAHNYLGLALTNAKRYQEAIDSYRKATVIDPGHVKAWNNLGVALQAAGQGAASHAAFSRVLAMDPRNRDAQNNLARLNRLTESKNAKSSKES